jgi:general secretion pathway protein D
VNSSQNSSLLKVDNNAKNRFWETLERNVKDLLRETDKQLPEGSSETFVQARGQGQTSTTQARSTPARRGSATQASTSTTTATPAPSNPRRCRSSPSSA